MRLGAGQYVPHTDESTLRPSWGSGWVPISDVAGLADHRARLYRDDAAQCAARPTRVAKSIRLNGHLEYLYNVSRASVRRTRLEHTDPDVDAGANTDTNLEPAAAVCAAPCTRPCPEAQPSPSPSPVASPKGRPLPLVLHLVRDPTLKPTGS